MEVTFTTEVKEEICSSEFEEWQLLSLLAGFVKVNGTLHLTREGSELALQTENPKVAKKMYNLLKTFFKVDPSYSYHKKMKLNKSVVYGIHVYEKAFDILEGLELMKDGVPCFPREVLLEDKLRYFIAGSFLASGSVNSPASKNYHLQMVISEEEDAKFYLKLLNRFRNERAMNFKMIQRGNKYVLYLKRADQIATFLSVVHAHNCLMYFENVRIEKDFINSDNRVQVCINANYQKALAKGEAQIKEIQFLFDHNENLNMSEKELAVAKARLDNVDAPLAQIASIVNDEYGINLSKSGVNHIFSRLHQRYVEVNDENRDS